MLDIAIGLLVKLMENLTLGWWRSHKKNEVQRDQNDINSLPDSDVDRRLRDDWTRK